MNSTRHIVDAQQGSEAWHQHRLQHFGASEAAAMLGLSLTTTRTELLRMKHTGLAREFSDWLQANVLDKGHEVEALARPHFEAIVGEDLYACTYADGRLSASCDGITMDEEIAFEHKQWSERLAAIVSAGEVPPEHMPQCQQVLMVTGAKKLIFGVSDGTPERLVYVWVTPDPAWFQRLRDGWAQFERDLAAYVLPEAAAPAPVGKAPDLLPALRIEVTGAVTASNLAEFKATALATIRSVNRTLKTDQDFADADKAVKWCADVEARLKAAKEHALSQTADIEALFRALDEIGAEAKTVRLDLDKLVTRRKTEVKEEAVARARRALDEHVAGLNAEIAPMRITVGPVDFAGAIKGLRSIASMQDALDTALAGAKIEADGYARVVRGNVATFQAEAAGFEFLFADLGQVVHKAADDFKALVTARIGTHKANEERKARERAEAEARAAEAARVAQEAARVAQEAAARAAAEASAKAAAVPPPVPSVPVQAAPVPPEAPIVPPPAPIVSAPRADEPATLKLGTICERLGFTVSAAFLADVLHVRAAKTDGRAVLFRESQFPVICRQLQSHVSAMAELYAGEPA